MWLIRKKPTHPNPTEPQHTVFIEVINPLTMWHATCYDLCHVQIITHHLAHVERLHLGA